MKFKFGTLVGHKYSALKGKVAAYATYENGEQSYGIRKTGAVGLDLVWIGANDIFGIIKVKKVKAKVKKKK